jgi:hypothetical protein
MLTGHEVKGVNAETIAAEVIEAQTSTHRPNMVLIRPDMRRHGSGSAVEVPISAAGLASLPLPAWSAVIGALGGNGDLGRKRLIGVDLGMSMSPLQTRPRPERVNAAGHFSEDKFYMRATHAFLDR